MLLSALNISPDSLLCSEGGRRTEAEMGGKGIVTEGVQLGIGLIFFLPFFWPAPALHR